MADRTLPPVGSRAMDAFAYERDLRRRVLDPFVRVTTGRLFAAEQTWQGILETLRETNPLGVEGDEETVARQNLAALDTTHRRRFFKSVVRAMGVDITREVLSEATKPLLIQGIETNVGLIKTINPRYHAKLRGDLEKLLAHPFDDQRLKRVLRDGYKSAGYNLRRLTRDQSNKLNGQFNRARQTAIGIEEYRWRSSEDERVRPTHVALNGTRQRWDTPPPVEGHPGHAIMCRCVALGIVRLDNRRSRQERWRSMPS